MFGNRLRLARKRAGLSLQALAERVSPPVSAQAISKYESGQMMPSSSVLIGLSKALDVSLDFLMSGQVEELSQVEFRKHSGTSAQDRARAEAVVIEALEDYLAIEEVLGLTEEQNPFVDVQVDAVASLDEAEDRAYALRDAWQLGRDPIPSLTGLLEEKGIKVIEANLPERFDGLACRVVRAGNRPPTQALVVAAATNIERRRFNLAHELAHRVIPAVSNPAIKLEKAMHRFAAAFLAPRDHLRQEVGENRHGITYFELIRLKRFYGMSAAAMLMRLCDVGLIPPAAVDYAFRTYARSWRNAEPEPIRDGEGLGAFERPTRFEGLVFRALGEQMISPIRAAQLLKRPLAKVEEEIRGPRAK